MQQMMIMPYSSFHLHSNLSSCRMMPMTLSRSAPMAFRAGKTNLYDQVKGRARRLIVGRQPFPAHVILHLKPRV